jgi:hypothetical protein
MLCTPAREQGNNAHEIAELFSVSQGFSLF